jgi:hypothetical protein
MPENWSIGFLVPNELGRAYMERWGAPKGSVAIWDAGTAAGLNEAVTTIRTATDNFMTARTQGVRGTRSIFGTGVDVVNKATVSTLTPLDKSSYSLHPVSRKERIDDYVNTQTPFTYRAGMAYYQLTKTEVIQPQKEIIVVEKSTGKAFGGKEARDLIGLPNYHTKVKPDRNPEYDIFVQSTSFNRNLMPNTRVLIKK